MRKKLLMSMLLVSVMLTVSLAGVGGNPSVVLPNLYMDPSVLWDPDMGPGSMITLDICVDYVEELWGYQITLSFDPTILYGMFCMNGPFLGSAGGNVMVIPGPGFDNTAGKMGLFGAALVPKANFPTGGGVLASVTFMVIGIGSSPVNFEINSALFDKDADRIIGISELYLNPNPPPEYLPKNPPHTPEAFINGFFTNVGVPPELYIRRRGAFGVSGIIEEWQTGYVGQEQTFYSKVLNYGHGGAMIKVKYVIQCMPYDVVTAWTEEASLGPVYLEGNKWIPTEVVVSASFMPPGPGKYHCYGIIYFKAGDMTDYYPYHLTNLEGEGASRDTNVAFKVYPD